MITFINGCPQSEEDYWPCRCTETKKESKSAIQLDCSNKNLTNPRASKILKNFLSDPPVIERVEELNFSQNRLTKVPDEIRHFHKSRLINLSKNKIRNVPTGAFNLSSDHAVQVLLNSNKIKNIKPNAFQGIN